MKIGNMDDLERAAAEIEQAELEGDRPRLRRGMEVVGAVTKGTYELGQGDDPAQGKAIDQELRGRGRGVDAAEVAGRVRDVNEQADWRSEMALKREAAEKNAPKPAFEEVEVFGAEGVFGEENVDKEAEAEVKAAALSKPDSPFPMAEVTRQAGQHVDMTHLTPEARKKVEDLIHAELIKLAQERQAQGDQVAFTVSASVKAALDTLFNDFVSSDRRLLEHVRRMHSIGFAGVNYQLTAAEFEEIRHRAVTNGLTLEAEIKRMLDFVRPYLLNAASH